jgi:hypothetical protein
MQFWRGDSRPGEGRRSTKEEETMTISTTPQHLPDVPVTYAGLWIAWNDERTAIIASGIDVAEVREAARRVGALQPLLEKVPRVDTHYAGRL